jgi:hypothetical protein
LNFGSSVPDELAAASADSGAGFPLGVDEHAAVTANAETTTPSRVRIQHLHNSQTASAVEATGMPNQARYEGTSEVTGSVKLCAFERKQCCASCRVMQSVLDLNCRTVRLTSLSHVALRRAKMRH